MESNDMTLAETYAYVGTQLDIIEFMNHQIVQIYLGAGDNFFKNVKYLTLKQAISYLIMLTKHVVNLLSTRFRSLLVAIIHCTYDVAN